MRKVQSAAILAMLLAVLPVAVRGQTPAAAPATPPPPMVLSSPAFTDGGIIPNKYTQASPTPVSFPLTWENPPAGTISYALIMHDVENAREKHIDDTLHWMIFNIPGTARALPEGIPSVAQLPDGTVQGRTRTLLGFMGPAYSGPVYHHYVLEMYALDAKLPLDTNASRADVLKAMDGHILGKGIMVGRFHR